jgi:hypothetical protein
MLRVFKETNKIGLKETVFELNLIKVKNLNKTE